MKSYGVVYFLLFFLILNYTLLPLTLDRVILGVNDNPDYSQFWPIAAKAWQDIVGVRPTLAFIAPADVEIDESLGDVIRFEPIEGIPTSFYAQCVRLFLPCLFPNDGCIVADIDLLPLQRKFFTNKIGKVADNKLVIYKDRAYWWYKPRIYMCYNAAKGSTFREIFGIKTKEDIPEAIKRWHQVGLGWSTDEHLLYQYVRSWQQEKNNKKRVKKFGYDKDKKRRICRKDKLSYSKKKLQKQYYVEINCPKPYSAHKDQIDPIMQLAFLAAQQKAGKY